ncbi:MAG: hypothetical protein ABIO63_00940, partial [Casimicrobiaceae bacterium]
AAEPDNTKAAADVTNAIDRIFIEITSVYALGQPDTQRGRQPAKNLSGHDDPGVHSGVHLAILCAVALVFDSWCRHH